MTSVPVLLFKMRCIFFSLSSSQKKVLIPFLPFLQILFYGGPLYFTCLGRRRGTCDGKSTIHPRNLWVQGSILTRGSQPAKLPSFGGYSLENLEPYMHVHSQLVLSASDSSFGNMTLQTGYTFACGSLKCMQFLLVCMQARFGPPHSYDRAKKWTILYKNG